MAKVFMLTEAELDQLVEQLELEKLRASATQGVMRKAEIEDVHRIFHMRVVRWVQDVAGHKGR